MSRGCGVESTTGAAALGLRGFTVSGGFRPCRCRSSRRSSVSSRRSSNWTCRFSGIQLSPVPSDFALGIAKAHASTARNLLGLARSEDRGGHAVNDTMSLSQRADALEAKMARELDYIVIKSRLYSMTEGDISPAPNANALMKNNPNARVLMGDEAHHGEPEHPV